MPDFEFEFNQQDKDLVLSQDSGQLSDKDYVRLTIYPSEALNNIVDLTDNTKGVDGKAIFFATLSSEDILLDISPFKENNLPFLKIIDNNTSDFKIYVNENSFGDAPPDIYIKPNEIFNTFELPEGNYRIQIDFLNQMKPMELPFPFYFEEFNISQVDGSENFLNSSDLINWVQFGRQDIANKIAEFIGGEIPLPPNYSDFAYSFEEQGDTPLPAPYFGPDYFKADNFTDGDTASFYFIIKQISTSRKEIRLKLRDTKILNNSQIITDITNQLNNNIDESNPEFIIDNNELSITFGQQIQNPNYKYQFQHVLNIGNGDHIPIMNYQFDKITDGKDNQSLILKLYESLPTNISNLSLVTIEKEILTTQIQDIYYFSDVPDVFFGDGLIPDTSQNYINPDNNQQGFQSLEELSISQSIGDVEVNTILSSSDYGYPNLNINFNKFSNHTFFGSAKSKLQNFKKKVETIQSLYTQISSSLTVSSSIRGDSLFIIQKRKDLFNKIDKEFQSFSPYERFLYFDGQSESSASAPSLINYADIIPVNDDGKEVNQINGFKTLYEFSSDEVFHNNQSENINLFTNKYFVQNKPFFNYSSSIYLSFLIKGDSGSSLQWDNNNINSSPPFPQDTLYQNNIIDENITGSEYRRYIFEASQSYFLPNTQNNDLADLENEDFKLGSSKIQILSGSIKTGSVKIKDSTNQYPTTVVSQSGVPFFGSVMPSGELFRIFYKNNLSASLFAHYNYENIIIDDRDFEVFDVSGNGRTISWVGGSTDSFTSASIETGVDGKISSSLKWSGSGAPSSPTGLMYFDSAFDNEAGRVTFTTSSGVDQGFDGFTFATWFKTEDVNLTIMALDIKSSGSVIRDNTAENHASLDDVDGWWLGKNGGTISGQVTDQGHKVLDDSDFAANPTHVDLTDEEFHHYALSWNQTTGTGSLYIDGVNVKTLAGYPLSGSNVIYKVRVGNGPGSALGYGDGQWDETRFYLRSLSDNEINQLFLHPDGKTETKITDVKVTLKDPTSVLPFDNIFKTTSTEFTNWYNTSLIEAETFDNNNIHSFENNLPEYIRESSDYQDMKDFLNLQGEQYDLIRNHIDSMGTIHKRGYKKNNSPPNNTLPMLLSNMGYEPINPFTGSLTETLGSYLSGVTSIDDIKNNTWRKTLNNLIYIYKSKGTKNSVRGLLNVYGYPPDVLQFKEFGGSTSTNSDEIVPGPFDDEIPTLNQIDVDLVNSTGSYSFTSNKEILYRYIFNGKHNRVFNLNWWMENANINTIQFVYKHSQTKNTQTILKSSGSGNETLWDLRLLPSSDGLSSSFEFRLNNSQRADTDIGSRGFSMSLAHDQMTDGQLWNVMLQRMTGTSSGPGTVEYRLHSTLQKESQIERYNYVTMSISGGLVGNSSTLGGKGFFANQNFQSTGSRGFNTSSNLSVGETISGSMAEIRGWSTSLSKSKFQQHTLNKFSTVGNNILSHCNELVYHFKLNENYNSASVSSSNQMLSIIDASPTLNYRNYSFETTGSLYTGSVVYGFDFINVNRLTLLDNNSQKSNDNNILINPQTNIGGNLTNSSFSNNINNFKKPKFKTSTKLELYRSPQNFVDNFIIDKISGFNLEKLYGNPRNFYSQSYKELDNFRKDFFICHPVKSNINQFIRAQESMFNESIIQGLQSLTPARTNFSENTNFGVEIKPTILEKQKYENEEYSIETNPNTATGSHELNVNLSETIYDSIEQGEVIKPVSSNASLELPITTSISLGNSYVTSSGYLKNSPTKNHFHPPFLQPGEYVTTIENSHDVTIDTSVTLQGSTVVLSKDGTYDYALIANKSYSDVHKNWGRTNNDVQHINFAAPTGSDGTFNTYAIETRHVFHTIGDNEYYSASFNNTNNENGASHFTNINHFYNQLQVDIGPSKNVNYFTLQSIGRFPNMTSHNANNPHQIGKRMGKTRFMREVTSFDGLSGNTQLVLPRNHVSKFSQPFKKQMTEGTQNTNPGFLNVRHEDYSSASFYRVKVTGGENQIYVKGTSNPTKDDTDDRILY